MIFVFLKSRLNILLSLNIDKETCIAVMNELKPYLVFFYIVTSQVMFLDISFFLNRYDDAIQLYDRILQEDPTNTVSLSIALQVTS
jgi:hypothetical protein